MNTFGLCGLGNVGSGVIRLLRENGSLAGERWGLHPWPKHILVRDFDKPRPVDVPRELLTTDPRTIIDDPDIDVVVELIGGRDTAREIVLESLRRGKSVVTANKDLLAYHGPEILEIAAEHGAEVYFEASVAGGTPIIRPLKYSLAADRITTIKGILNGTTNYILTRMTRDGRDYASSLAEAQANGYAESDPADDVEGRDAVRKLAILATVAFGTPVNPDQIYMEGIAHIQPRDIAYARELGYVIKLVATARDRGDTVEVRVHPTLLPEHHPLAKVDGSFNSVMVEGNFVGNVTFTGRGAGGGPTASAVVADLLEALHNRRANTRSPQWTCHRRLPVLPMAEVSVPYYLRFTAEDRPGVLGQMAQILGRHGVNLRSVIQKPAAAGHATRNGECIKDGGQAELVFLTSCSPDKNVRAALAELGSRPELCRLENLIRGEPTP